MDEMTAPLRIATLDVALPQQSRLARLLDFPHEFVAPTHSLQKVDASWRCVSVSRKRSASRRDCCIFRAPGLMQWPLPVSPAAARSVTCLSTRYRLRSTCSPQSCRTRSATSSCERTLMPIAGKKPMRHAVHMEKCSARRLDWSVMVTSAGLSPSGRKRSACGCMPFPTVAWRRGLTGREVRRNSP